MKVDRLLTMTMILLNRKNVKAQELAELLNVSIRTVYRDVETLSRAGIPVFSQQGANGGIRLIDGYRMDKQVLTKEELASLSIALNSVLTSYEDRHAEAVLEKLIGVADEAVKKSANQVMVDWSSWGNDGVQKEKMTICKQAIETQRCLRFSYSSSSGHLTNRVIDPHTLVYKERRWYVYGFCRLRNKFRIFKLSRMKELQTGLESFQRKPLKLAELPWKKEWNQPENLVKLILAYERNVYPMMADVFGEEQIDASQCLIRVSLPENEWLYGFLLSFGPRLQVIEPPHIVEVIKQRAAEIVRQYEK
ncbi:helix-turn-helix transcriptional regulator [Bacillus xiapuensis]|uniref:helix-turn-helix transcriptional regulator n=1 Tax=Bacillus xiapuensis TaxID=2014075 RepID=UPI000C24233B|nr:YafY family protein [Bacillus xiapuensis]